MWLLTPSKGITLHSVVPICTGGAATNMGTLYKRMYVWQGTDGRGYPEVVGWGPHAAPDLQLPTTAIKQHGWVWRVIYNLFLWNTTEYNWCSFGGYWWQWCIISIIWDYCSAVLLPAGHPYTGRPIVWKIQDFNYIIPINMVLQRISDYKKFWITVCWTLKWHVALLLDVYWYGSSNQMNKC